MGEKKHTEAVVDVSRATGGRNLLYQRIWKWNLDQNLIMDLLIVAVCTVLVSKLRRQELCSFSFKMFNIKIFKIFKMFKYSMKFIRAACWINSKISNRDTTLIIFLFYNYCLSLLWWNYWRSSNSTSWILLKLTVQTQLVLYLCDSFLTNNCNMAGNSVDK